MVLDHIFLTSFLSQVIPQGSTEQYSTVEINFQTLQLPKEDC